MPKSTPTCNSIINLMYRETTWANVAENASAAPPAIQPEPQSFLDGINVEYDISDVLAIDVEAPDSDLTAILAADVEGMDNGIEQALASIDVGVFDDDIESILMD